MQESQSRKHIIVTGGSRGLGEAMVRSLLERGYRVSACSRSRSPFVDGMEKDESLRTRFFWHACSVGDSEDVQRFVRASVEWAGEDGVYGLINNAGVAKAGILATFPDVESERIIQVNLIGSIQMARAVSGVMLRGGKPGRIINISSIIGSRGYNGLSAYSASKAGMDGLTRALARELGRRAITVNSIAPGYIRTEMSSTLDDQQLDQIVRRTPLGRLASAEDIVGLVNFLLSSEAAMLTGQTITVDGGVSC
jgi:3-oxoacyl-[acyl-carrier protein] reductase